MKYDYGVEEKLNYFKHKTLSKFQISLAWRKFSLASFLRLKKCIANLVFFWTFLLITHQRNYSRIKNIFLSQSFQF